MELIKLLFQVYTMKEEALVMTIDFGKNHFNAIHLNNQLKLISCNECMITINDHGRLKAHEQTEKILTRLIDFFKH
jgi:hypothetical protein